MKTLTLLLSAALLLAARPLHADDAKIVHVKVTGHGQPVILIPGLACDGSVWDATVKHLQEKYECHVVSLAGFGSTPAVKTGDFMTAARDQIIAYAQEHALKNPALIGHSLGGTLALTVGEKAPELPGQIIAVDGLPFLAAVMFSGVTDVEGAKKSAAAMQHMMEGQTREQFAHYQRTVSIPSMVTKPQDVTRIADMCAQSDPAIVQQVMVELFTRDYRAELGQIKCPILVLGALAGLLQYAPREILEQNYRSQFTNAPQTRFAFFDKAKHFIMFDDPTGFDALLDKALASH